MPKDPLRHLTRGIAEAVEHTPAFIAMTEGNGVIPTTWGDLASRLVEADIIEPSIEEVCDFLSLEPEDLRDSRLVIADRQTANLFEGFIIRKYKDRFAAQHEERAKTDIEALNDLFETWRVDDGEERADRLQAEISIDAKALREHTDDQEEQWKQRTELNIKCMMRDAYGSGYAVGMEELVATLLSRSDLDYFTLGNIAEALASIAESACYEYRLDEEDVSATDIVVGKKALVDLMNSLEGQFRTHMRTAAEAHWETIRPFIYASRLRDHFLFAGNEK